MAKKSKYTVRKDGLHEAIRVIDGKRKAFRGRSDAEVEQKMIAYKGEVAKSKDFSVVAEKWESFHFPSLSPNTLKGYRAALKRSIAHFGERPINAIKPTDIKGFLNSFARKGYSQKVISNQRLVINLICTFAVEESGDLDSNPCLGVKPPKGKPRVPRDAASEKDEAIIKKTANLWLLPFFILYTGMRKGEALATRGKNVDITNKEISVTHSVYYVNSHPQLKSPKTAKSVRKIPILNPLLPVLPKLKKEQFLFSLDGGKTPLTAVQYKNLLKSYVEKTKITATAHMLRHSFASMLFECDVSSKDAQPILGHATKAMTDDIYTHLRDSRKNKIVDKINSALEEATQ